MCFFTKNQFLLPNVAIILFLIAENGNNLLDVIFIAVFGKIIYYHYCQKWQ